VVVTGPSTSPLSASLIRALLVLGVTMILDWGILYYSLALLAPRIVADTGWPETMVFGGFSMALLTSGLFAPLSGRSVDRHGGRPVLTLGVLVGALGFGILASCQSLPVYFLAWALIGAGMAGCLYDPAFATIAQLAGAGTRRAISLLTLAGGFASTAAWPATLWLLQRFDWRDVAFLYTGVLILVCAPLHAFVLPRSIAHIRSHSDLSPSASGEQAQSPPRRDPTALVLFALVIAGHGFVTSALSVHLVHTLDLLGISEEQAVLAGSLVGPAQVGARLIEMLFGKRLSALALGIISTGLLPLSFAIILALEVSTASALIFGLVYGASNGLVTIARGVVPYALFGPEGYGRTLGLISGPALATKAAAPMAFAWMMGHLGAMTTLGISCAIAASAFALMTCLAWLYRNRTAVTSAARA
jgi:MFS family permease